jgi:hypothetical protein
MKKTLLALSIMAGAIAGTQASIFSEQFDYPDGGIVANSSGVWINNSGTPGTCLVSNKTLLISSITARSEDIAHQFVPGFTNSTLTNIFARFKFRCTPAGIPSAGGTYFFGFATTAANNYIARTWVNTTNLDGVNVAPAGSFYMGVGNNTPASSGAYPTNGQLATPLNTNVTYTVVVRHCLTNGLATIWVGTDPTTMTEDGTPSATATDTSSVTSNIVNYVNFRQANNEGELQINDLKVGRTWDDVFFAPAISPVADQSIPANQSTAALDFAVESPITSANNIIVTASSSNPTLVPNVNISLASDAGGTNRTVEVTPANGLQGVAVITLTATAGSASSTTTFKVIVGAPSISPVANEICYTNTIVPPISFTVNDAEGDPLTFYFTSSNTNLLKTNNISVSTVGNTRTLTATPVAGMQGATTITLFATDGFNTTSTSFTLTMRPHIGMVYSEDFLYNSWVPGLEQQLTGGSGGSGGPWTHVSGAANQIDPIQVTNFGTYGLAYLIHTNSETAGANFTGGATYTGSNSAVVLYTSFPVNFSYLPSPNGDYFFMLKTNAAGTGDYHDKVTAQTKNAAPGKFRLAIANFASAATASLGIDLKTNTTYTVVTRFNSATGESVVWVNPFNEQSPSAIASDSPGSAIVGGVGLRQPSSAIGDLTVGPMKVSTEWSDVVGTVSPLKIQQTDATHVQLSWSYPFTLQTSSSLAPASWSDVAGATSPYTYTITGDQQYFRLSY